MEVKRLLWWNANLAKLAQHAISREDVLEVVMLDRWVEYVHPDYPEQLRIVGPTGGGRLITVVLDPTDGADRWRPVTGWDATDEEREYYSEENR